MVKNTLSTQSIPDEFPIVKVSAQWKKENLLSSYFQIGNNFQITN